MQTKGQKPQIDWSITIPSLLILLAISFFFLFANVSSNSLLSTIFELTTNVFGGIYQIYIFLVLLLLGYVSVSKIGNIRLGEGPPPHSTLSWGSMLFCSCIGSSILYWGLIEWGYYMMSPPFGLEPMSSQAAEISVGYTMFHWGLSGWATYAMAAVIIAFYYFVKKIPNLRISVACGFTKENGKEKFGKIVDTFVIIGLSAGVAVSAAIGTPMISQGLYHLFGIVPSLVGNIIIALFLAFLFGASAISGINKGVKFLSNFNSIIALGFILYVALAGSTSFIANNAANSLGVMLQNFSYMSFYTDPINKSGFPQNWTVFYWAWWISYVPIMGLFIAKISRGRTIRQVAVSTTIMGSVGSWLFQTVLGGYGIDKQLSGSVDTIGKLQAGGDYEAIIALLNSLPFGNIVIFAFIIITFIFLTTTCDSSAYILASIATKDITDDMDPSKFCRLLWSIAIIAWPIVLLIVGGIDAAKLCSVLGSIPILFIFYKMIRNFLKDVRKYIDSD
ncbi:BCCT family transporter [Paenibacillus aceti]|nr:BCCT family transporter [Paenibacillus aceti]